MITDNAEYLVKQVYASREKEPYNDKLTRVGLVMKVLLKSGISDNQVSKEVLDPVIADVEELIDETEDVVQKDLYSKELRYLLQHTLFDDILTLNADIRGGK